MAKILASKDKTLVVFALHAEAGDHFGDFHVLYTGVGKVNAAYKLAIALEAWKAERGSYPELVVNVGSAGSSLFKRGTIVNCTQFIQRDMDVTAFGHTKFATPNEDASPVFSVGLRHEDYTQGVCGSGDSFATDGAMQGWNVVDMEAYALAKVCAGQKVPFCCLKYVSDGGGDDATSEWSESMEVIAEDLEKAVSGIVLG